MAGNVLDPNDLLWEEPPETAGGGGGGAADSKWQPIADALKQHPRQWARIATYEDEKQAYSGAGNIRRGKIRAFSPKGDFEARARKMEDGYIVYARYIGTEVPATA